MDTYKYLDVYSKKEIGFMRMLKSILEVKEDMMVLINEFLIEKSYLKKNEVYLEILPWLREKGIKIDDNETFEMFLLELEKKFEK